MGIGAVGHTWCAGVVRCKCVSCVYGFEHETLTSLAPFLLTSPPTPSYLLVCASKHVCIHIQYVQFTPPEYCPPCLHHLHTFSWPKSPEGCLSDLLSPSSIFTNRFFFLMPAEKCTHARTHSRTYSPHACSLPIKAWMEPAAITSTSTTTTRNCTEYRHGPICGGNLFLCP
jgi:hypothetical protein